VPSDEDLGGDPACWSHLFESDGTAAIDLVEMAVAAPGHGPIWTEQTDDLNINLLRFNRGEGVAEHINPDLDVILIGISGSGLVTVDGTSQVVTAHQLLTIPKGATRSIEATDEVFAYLSIHRRRPALMPKPATRSEK
jgi:quercetin dioxygenase-like cupin family protein